MRRARRFSFVVVIAMLGASASAAMSAQESAPARNEASAEQIAENTPTAPVELDGNVLFRVRGVSSYPAEQRAEAIRDRIVSAASNARIPLADFRIMVFEGQVRIVAADTLIMAIVPADARMEQMSAETLALAHLMRVREAVASYRQARAPAELEWSAVHSVVATLVLLAAILASIKAATWLNRLLAQRLEKRIHSIGIQSFELMRAERIVAALRSIVSGVRAGIILASVILYLGYVLRQWPWTRGLARNLYGFILAPLKVLADGFVRHLPSLIFLAVLFVILRTALKLCKLFFEAVGRGEVTFSRFDPDWAQPTYKIVRLGVIAFGLIIAYPYIPGSESAAFKGVSLFLGILFSLGSSTALSNIIAGYMMTYRRAFKVGDRVKVGDTIGYVMEVRLGITRMRSVKNEELIIPNSEILSHEVTNFTSLAQTRGLILHTEVGIGYETPWRQVEAMLLQAAARTPGLSREPSPYVLLKKLGDFAVVYELNAYTRDVPTMHLQYTAMHRHILDVFNEYGVQIMTPAYEGDPPVAKVVSREQWYTAPAAPPVENGAPPVTRGDGALPATAPATARATH